MTGLTIAQGRALIRIIEGWDNGTHVTRPDVPTKTRAALFDAGLITIGTMVYPDALHPTDDGRAAAAKVLARLNRDPNSVHEWGSYEWARAREQEALDAQARHHADTAPGTHPASDDLIGADIPTQDQLARAEQAAAATPDLLGALEDSLEQARADRAARLEVVPDPDPEPEPVNCPGQLTLFGGAA